MFNKTINILLIVLLTVLSVVLNVSVTFAEAVKPIAEEVPCQYGTCYKVPNPVANKPKLELVPSRNTNISPAGSSPVNSPASQLFNGTLLSLYFATPLGQDMIRDAEEALTKADYAAYNYLHDTMIPFYEPRLNDFYSFWLNGTKILPNSNDIVNSLVGFINTFHTNNFNDTIFDSNGEPIYFPNDRVTWTPSKKQLNSPSTSKVIAYLGFLQHGLPTDYLPYRYYYMYKDDNGLQYILYGFYGKDYCQTVNNLGFYSSIDAVLDQFDIISNASNITYKKLKGLPAEQSEISSTFNGDEVAIPYFPDFPNNQIIPRIIEMDGKKYWEIPNIEGTTAYQPIDNPNAQPILQEVVMTPEGIVINPDGTPTGQTLVPNDFEYPQPNYEPTPEPMPEPYPEEPYDPNAPKVPGGFNPLGLLMPFVEFLLAMLYFLIRFADFIITIPFTPAKPIPPPYGSTVDWFMQLQYGSIKPYKLMISVVSLLFGFAIYKMIRRVF